jgi:GNAT superfamily N-acetyltransferase
MLSMRPACEPDMAALWTLRTAAVRHSCASHYAPDVIDAWCAAAPPNTMNALLTAGGALVVDEAGCARGYAILNIATGEIDALFVDPAHQGRGIARSLMSSLEDIARHHGLAQLHLSASLNAVQFYERAGFGAVRPQSYAHRSGITLDSVFMVKRVE